MSRFLPENRLPLSPALTAEWRLVTTRRFVNSFEENRWQCVFNRNEAVISLFNVLYIFFNNVQMAEKEDL